MNRLVLFRLVTVPLACFACQGSDSAEESQETAAQATDSAPALDARQDAWFVEDQALDAVGFRQDAPISCRQLPSSSLESPG